jgi:hypothetical protein
MGTIASAGTVAIGGAAANYLQVTGTTTITAFDSVIAGVKRKLEFAGAVTLTHNATSLILPQGANVTTAAGDVWEFTSEGSGNWRASQWPVRYATKAIMQAGTDSAAVVTPARANDANGAAKAWAIFNGGTGTILDSFNVASVTKNGTGDYTVNFTTAFATASYAAVVAAGRGSSGANNRTCGSGAWTAAPTTAAHRFLIVDSTFSAADAEWVSAVYYGKQ